MVGASLSRDSRFRPLCIKALTKPRLRQEINGLAGKIRRDRKGSANDFTALDGEIDVLTGLIAQDDIEFRAEGLFHQFWQIISRRSYAIGTALWRCRCVANIVHRFIRRVSAHVQKMV